MRCFCVFAIMFAASTPALAQDAEEPAPWSLSASGGLLMSGDDGAPFGTVALSRDFGASFVRVSGSVFDSAADGRTGTLPSTFYLGTLTAGTSIGALSLDMRGSIGTRRFSALTVARPGATIEVDRTSGVYALGGNATYDIAIGKGWFVSPALTVDYSSTRTVGEVVVGERSRITESEQDGVSASLGGAVQRVYGPASRNSFGVTADYVVTSNNAASVTTLGSTAAPRPVEGEGVSDAWAELGVTASFALTPRLSLDLAGVHSFGARAGDAGAVSTGLRLRF